MAKRRSKSRRQKKPNTQKASVQQSGDTPVKTGPASEAERTSVPWKLVGGGCLIALSLGIILPQLGSDPDPKPSHDDPSRTGKGDSAPLRALATVRSESQNAAAKQNLDPRTGGWGTEADAEQAKKELGALLKLAVSEEELDPNQLSSVSPEFSSFEIRPSGLVQTFDDASIRIWKGSSEQSEIHHKDKAGFVQALTDFVKPLRELNDVHTHVKVVRITVADAIITTEAIIETGGTSALGSFGQHTDWTCRWESKDDSLRLLSIQVDDYQEATASGPGGFIFSEGTEDTLAEVPSFETQLRHGTDYWLERIEKRLGIDRFEHHGVALGDINGDGLEDLYLCQPGGLPNQLCVQQPDGSLIEMSAGAGVDLLDFTRNALFIDLDNDGDQDLVMTTSRWLVFFANDGTGKFTPKARLAEGRGGYSLAAADHDGDQDLDLFVCIYGNRNIGDFPQPIPHHDANNGGPNVLIRNDGNWKFTDATEAVGLNQNNQRYSFAAAWEDYDNDGDVDLYVANDFGRNNLYRNEEGKFTDVAAEAGVEDVATGMSVSWGDYNQDGHMDVYIGNMFSAAGNRITFQRQFKSGSTAETRKSVQRLARGNSLFENSGDGTFRDVSEKAGVTMGRWAWASVFADINNDGWEDLLVTNGYLTQTDDRDL